MIEIAELTSQQTLNLPSKIASHFHPSDRFAVWVDGDTLFLKRITTPAVTETVAQSPEGEPLSLDEINRIVHDVRRRRQTG